MRMVHDLMKTSTKDGPGTSVQWAAHPPKNHYCLTVITKEAQAEVVANMVCVIRNLFWGKAVETEKGVGGIGDVWYNNKKRRKTDWESNSDCLKHFDSADSLRSVLNKEY
eukprot:CAMPEP_0172513468 /NCGR_PEP_ID=MMETSP1066-20121228/252716_1 /TAXON_ID=671091 /ORGANISM="Coscinodiscus wailesii, Strain CCMP2513" /LENGTH=109 /DNA_ID=CAMNT_0013293745 /DNA_START=1 /DNA_END=330 /DNA_ORIENTATION=-